MAKKREKFRTHRVSDVQADNSIEVYSSQAFPILGSKTAAQKAMAAGRLFLNGKRAQPRDRVRKGDVLKLAIAKPTKPKFFAADLQVIYEDEVLLVVNKPAGIAVNGNRNKTVENAVVGVAKKSMQPDALPQPVAVHRIDVPTRGLVLLAKTKSALIRLSKAFQQNQVQKEYVAVVHGRPKQEGTIDLAVQRKRAITYYQTLEMVPSRAFNALALLRLRPITGRTHQLRIHLQAIGHLIVGDKQYAGNQPTILGKGLYLCACRLQFDHPQSQERVDVQIEVPPRFQKLLRRESARY